MSLKSYKVGNVIKKNIKIGSVEYFNKKIILFVAHDCNAITSFELIN